MIDHFPLPLQGKPERRHLYRWVKAEEEYVFTKFDGDGQREDHDKGMIERDLDKFWVRQIVQYLDRAKACLEEAKQLREDGDLEQAEFLELKALQALAKCFMTSKGCMESAIRVLGTLPKPGVSSGDVRKWIDVAYPRKEQGDGSASAV